MKDFKFYRSQVLFTGLTHDEMLAIESGVNRYNLFYKDSIANVSKLEAFDVICIPESDYLKNQTIIESIKTPIIIIGDKKLPKSHGLINRPIFIRQCLEILNSLSPAVKKPLIEPIVAGSIVKSKTTPTFGKGIVVSVISEQEVLVRFPKSNLLSMGKDSIRCHKSQLQVLGNVDSLIDNN